MSGVTWDERAETDWLASNGRWYPRSSYPSGWAMSALPPAPGQTQAGSILRRVAAQFNELADEKPFDRGRTQATRPPASTAPPRPPKTATAPRATSATRASGAKGSTASAPQSGTARASDRSFLPKEPYRHPNAPAPAEVIAQRTYKPKVTAGPPPPAAIPPPPGRISDVRAAPEKPPPPKPVPSPSPTQDATGSEVIAGDLGKVLGVAKRRITQAINDAAELDK